MDHNSLSATPMFVALDPEPRLADLVWAYKRRVESLVGPQTYLDHPPHLTVYLAAFGDPKPVIDEMHRFAAESAPVSLRITGWHVFVADKLTGGNTLVCQLAEDSIRRLRTTQQQVIDRLAPLRHVAATQSRYASRRESLAAAEKSAIRRTGFSYIGEQWHPHVTIASIRQSDWPTVEGELLADAPRLVARCPTLSVFRLDDGHPVSVSTCALGQLSSASDRLRSIAS